MQSQLESERLAVRSNIISIDRPDSSQLVDLHIYIIPKSVWKNLQNLAENETMERAISAGFVHVPQNLNLNDLRQHILKICGQDDAFPKQFIYLRSVGRCLTKVKPQQETELRVKNYRPPMTFAPEIYVLEGHHDDEHVKSANSKSYLFRESPIQQALNTPPQLTSSRQQSWVKPRIIPPIPSGTKLHRSFVRSGERKNSTNFQGHPIASYSNLSAASSTLSARELSKLREEQERLRQRQIELARQRREIEQEQERRQRELLEKQEKLTREQQRQENEAATQIQRAYRKYQNRRKLKQKQKQQQAANDIERLQKEARDLARRNAEKEHAEEINAHDVVKLADHLEELKKKRTALEATRETIIRQMQQLHDQIGVHRKEERELWKQRYQMEKKKTAALEERGRTSLNDQSDLNTQLEQVKIRLNNSTKLRQQAEYECQVLKQELDNMRSNMNNLQNPQSSKQPIPSQDKQHIIPITLDITLQY
ncbi:unnamed protein product [Rotaria socialis]|uniref:Spermatogenesis-associated protein 1 C-terminal domain-containing protein n=1 Tax=Rotaria socialis TaxID=392032 RepID=A0A818QG48_9BILA|nr:unnamed protein product [Rotaria socialis]CAF3640197.1 unnamed protein product [Rotaria socialis]